MLEQMVSSVAMEILEQPWCPWGNKLLSLKARLAEIVFQRCHHPIQRYLILAVSHRWYAPHQNERKGAWALTRQVIGRTWWMILLSTFVEPKLIQPTFFNWLTRFHYRLGLRKNPDRKECRTFEAFAGGYGDLLMPSPNKWPARPAERFVQQAKEKTDWGEESTVDEISCWRWNTACRPPADWDRHSTALIMILTNNQSIREVILFPTLKGKAEEQ